MPVFLSGVFYSRVLCRKEPFHVFTNRFYLGQRSPRPHPLCPSCHVCSFSPSHVRHRRSSYRRSVRFQHGRFRCGYRIPDHADCDEPHQFPCHGNDSPFGTEDRSKKAFRRRQNCRSLPDPFCPHRHCLQPLIDPGCGPLEPRHECSGSRFFEDGPLSIHLRRRRPHHDLL